MPTWHLTLATDGRHPLFLSEARRRRAVRLLAEVAADEAVMFAVMDDHVHLVALCDPERTGRLAAGLLLALRPVAEAPLDPARCRPVETRSHLSWLVRYLLTQPQHHALPVSPALWTGSCFPDLVGARAVFRLRIADALPRARLRDLFPHVGLPAKPLEPASDGDIRAAGAARIAAAAAASLAVGPDLSGKEAGCVLARRLCVQVGHAAGVPMSELAWALGQPVRSARRLLGPTVEARFATALRMRVALEDAVSARSVPSPVGRADGILEPDDTPL